MDDASVENRPAVKLVATPLVGLQPRKFAIINPC